MSHFFSSSITNPLFYSLKPLITGENMLKQLTRIATVVGMFLYMGAATAADLFSDAWMKAFMEVWNGESEITEPLKKIGFNSTICYGFKDADPDQPTGCIVVENGKVTKAGAYSGEEANWDLRAKVGEWQEWIKNGISKADLMLPGWAGGLAFEEGEYLEMMSSPSMWGPFVKSFEAMGKVK
jgi:hypothetical protein